MAGPVVMTTRVVGASPFGSRFLARVAAFEHQTATAAQQAADVAQATSKKRAKGLRPPTAPRRGRRQVSGALARAINWEVKNGQVVLAKAQLDQQVPWWTVQEIGTGNQAKMRRGNGQGKAGRPTKAQTAATNVRVKSQKGRRIPGSLAFAARPGGIYSAPGSATGQQLHLVAQLKGAPVGPRRYGMHAVDDLRIRREIQPKNFIQQGARDGFRVYRQGVLAAAKATLTKGP